MEQNSNADHKSHADLFPDSGEQNDQTSFSSPAAMPGKGGKSIPREPVAIVTRGRANEETFDVAGDEPDDKQPSRSHSSISQGNRLLDYVSAQLNALSNYYPDVRFDWCLGIEGRRMRFSRRYLEPQVLVDVFNNDTKAVRQEVERKRKILIAHNEEMSAMWEEKADELNVPAARLSYVSRGLVVIGYLPILSARLTSANFKSACLGVVCDLPEVPPPATVDPGSQLGVRTFQM